MPKTAYSQKFERELDPEQLLSLFEYDLTSDPDLKNIPETLRNEIRHDLKCPECGVNGGTIVSRSKSKKDFMGQSRVVRQSHFRFRASEGNESIHHPLCDHYNDSNPNSQKGSLVNFGSDRTFFTELIRELVTKGIEQKIFSQQTIRDMRQWFFDTKIENQFIMDVSEEHLLWNSTLRKLINHSGILFKPFHAELPDFDWKYASTLQFVEENRELIDLAGTRSWGADPKAEKKALKLIKAQGETVFDVTVLSVNYKKTVELALFMQRNIRFPNYKFWFNTYGLHSNEKLASVVAFSALLLYASSWDFDKAVCNLIEIVNAPTPTDMNTGNIIGLNPFHDLIAWEIIMKAREVAQNSHKGFDFDAQIKIIEQQLKAEYEEWKKTQ